MNPDDSTGICLYFVPVVVYSCVLLLLLLLSLVSRIIIFSVSPATLSVKEQNQTHVTYFKASLLEDSPPVPEQNLSSFLVNRFEAK